MAAYYSVVQYVPDPIADERINVGVITYGPGGLHCRFIRDWDRASRFGNEDVAYLREFARKIEEVAAGRVALLSSAPRLDVDALTRMANGWINTIQLSEPRASTLEAASLLDDIARDVLREPAPTKREFRDKRSIAAETARKFEDALERRFNRRAARRLVARSYPLQGHRDRHVFDIAVRNGRVFFGAFTISFELTDVEELHDQIKIVSWDMSDLRATHHDLRLAVIGSPPPKDARTYGEAADLYHQIERTCGDFAAEVIPEQEVESVADEVASIVPIEALPLR